MIFENPMKNWTKLNCTLGTPVDVSAQDASGYDDTARWM